MKKTEEVRTFCFTEDGEVLRKGYWEGIEEGLVKGRKEGFCFAKKMMEEIREGKTSTEIAKDLKKKEAIIEEAEKALGINVKEDAK